eukprot:GFUD01003929.1.p1 GENE.GFUD01003929.1~~GFUD01003929.1.p1  ORF type:complete len:159 (+),score=31.23 GFUD01003929.1:147-623(+)
MSTSVKFLPKFCGFLIPRVTVRTFYTRIEKNLKPISTAVDFPRTLRTVPPTHPPTSQGSGLAYPRQLHTTPPRFDSPSPAEETLISALVASFPSATDIAVVDISGGCGSMYEVHVEAPDFKGLRVVKQHQMVTRALSSQIKDMHGIRISTSPSPCQPQ